MFISSYRASPAPPPVVVSPPPPPAPAPPPGTDLGEDWTARSSGTQVFRALRFPSAANVNAFRFSSGVGHDPNPSAGSLGSYVRWNATDGIMGDGALELEQHVSDNVNSYWWLPFDPAKTTYEFNETGLNFAPGQDFWVQFREKTNCSGASSTGGGGRKVASASRLTASYTAQEIVMQDTQYRGVFQMYQGLALDGTAYKPFEEPAGAGDFNFQPGSEYAVPPGFCSYQQVNVGNLANCWTWGASEWICYLMHIKPSTDNVANGRVRVWAWKPGMSDYVLITRKESFGMRYDADKPHGYNAFLAWIYETGRTAGPANQKQWYDQVILSRGYVPPPLEVPAWYSSATASQWSALTGGPADTLSSINPCPANNCSYSAVEGQAGVIDDWCGAAASRHSLIIAAQGGHLGYAGNEVYEYVFNVATPRFHLRVNPSTSVQQEVGYYADGKPTSRHGYAHDCFIADYAGANGDRWIAPLAIAVYGNGGGTSPQVASYNRKTGTYDAQGTFPDYPGLLTYDTFVGYDPVTHKVWVQEGPGGLALWRLFSLDVATKTWSTHGQSTAMQNAQNMASFVDPVRRLLVGHNGDKLYVRDLAFPNDSGRVYTVTGLSGNAIDYEPVSGKWVSWNGGKTLRVITPPSNYRTGDGSLSNGLNASATYSIGQTITPADGATPSAANANGTYGRFRYIANPRGFCVVNRVNEPMYFFKVPAGGI